MVDIVRTRRSFTPGITPTALEEGQLAVNVPDKKIWIGDTGNLPVLIFSEASAGVSDHLLLTNIGVKTHVEIDAHIADITTNPHAVSYDNIGGTPPPVDWTDITNPPASFPPAAHTHTLAADITDEGTMAYEDDVLVDGIPYMRQDKTWIPSCDFCPDDVTAGQGIAVSLPGDGTVIVSSSNPTSVKANWKWNIAVTGDPGASYMLGDTASGATVTALSFSYTDADGNDVTDIAQLIKTGDQIQLLRDNAGTPVYSVWEVTADAIDNVTYSTVPVTIKYDSDPAGSPAQDDLIAVQWVPGSGEQLPPLPHQHDHLTDITNVGTNTHAAIDAHIADVTTNPHNVTYENLGGTQPAPVVHTHAHEDLTGDIGVLTHTQLDAHANDITTNPHQVTYEQLGGTQPAPLGHDHDGGTF